MRTCEKCAHYEKADLSKISRPKGDEIKQSDYDMCNRHGRRCYVAIRRGCGARRMHFDPIIEVKKVSKKKVTKKTK